MSKSDKKTKSNKPASVSFGSYPEFMYVWPAIVMPYLLWLCSAMSFTVEPLTQGWIYITVWLVIILTMGLDFNRNVAIFTIAVIGGLWGVNYWFENSKNILVLGQIFEFFGEFETVVSLDVMFVLSHLLLGLYIIMIVIVQLNDRWRITQNEIEHRAFGLQDDAIARAGKRIKARYPDLLEVILCGSGTITVLSTTGDTIIREIPNVPLLIFRMWRIDRILESQSMTVDQIAADEDESEAESA